MDSGKNNGGKLFGSNSTTVGTINGDKVEYEQFTEKIKQVEDQYGGRVSGAQVYQVRQTVWDQIVAEKVLYSEFDKLGLSFSPKELTSIIFSDDAPQTLKQAFTDQATGKYDIDKVREWWTGVKKFKDEQKQMVENQIIEPTKLNSLYGKYSALISGGSYYPSWMQKKETEDNKNFAVISYVSVPYSVISDSTVKVSDEDITAYLQKNAVKFKQDGGRQISYVSFSGNPDAADTSRAHDAIALLKDKFIADSNASAFVGRNGSSIPYDSNYVVKSKLTMPQKDSVAALPVGGVFGPYLDGKNFELAKMIAMRQLPDSVKCRHILIAEKDQQGNPKLDDSTAHARADSIATAIKNGADFNTLVLQYSDDPGSKDKKGEYDFTSSQIGSLAKEFSETIFFGAAGDKKVVKTDFGWHYIEVMSQKNFEPAYKIAYMAKTIDASEETTNAAASKATRLASEARDVKAFDAYVAKNNLNKISNPAIVKENDYQVGGLQDARQLVKWAFDAKVGDVSDAITINNQGADQSFVVAVVEKVIPEGLPDAASVRPQVEYIIRNQKKAEIIKGKVGTTLESAAAAYSKTVETAGADSTLTFGAQIINGLGQEPKVIGASFNKEYQTKVSPAIEGMGGVYVIKVNSIGTKPADAPEVAAEIVANRAKSIMQQGSYGWFEALKKQADIKDTRSKFF